MSFLQWINEIDDKFCIYCGKELPYDDGTDLDSEDDASYPKEEQPTEKTEFIHCFLDNSVKGIIFPELDRCIVNILPYEEGGLINALDSGYAQALRELKRAQAHFQDALSVHDEWEKYYIDNFSHIL